MLPYSLPSSVSAFGRRQMKAYPYTPKAGDVAWVNYIPVKFVSENYQEGTYNQKGFVAIDILSSNTGKQAWVDYVPVVIDDTRTDAWLVNRVGYIPVNFSGTGDGTASNKGLSLNFLGADRLDPRITFSRASNATVTNSSGLITYAPHNLLTYSEQFDNAAWTKNNISSTANTSVTAAPNETFTADKLVEDTSTAAHFIGQTTSYTAGIPYTLSYYAKAAERTFARIGFTASSFPASGRAACFNLSTGAVGDVQSGVTASITSVGNGWYRCSITVTATTTASSVSNGAFIAIQTTNTASADTYTGNGTSGIYVWGAQLNVGSLQPYYPTTVKNLLGYSEAFDNAAWSKSNATVTANAVAAPNGTMTADKLVEDTANSTHLVYAGTSTLVANTDYTVSVYLKAAERTNAVIGSVTGGLGTGVNLATGTLTDVAGIAGWVTATNRSITNVGNGWYRVSVTIPNATGGNALFDALRIFTSNGTTGTYTGDGTSGIYVWGAQLSDSASLDPYVNNPVAAPTAAAYYGPRFDYDPETLQPKGLLIEEQRTNLLTNSISFATTWTGFGASVASSTTVSPDGSNAVKFVESATTAEHGIFQTTTTSGSNAYSVYLKYNGRRYAVLRRDAGTVVGIAVFDLQSGLVTQETSCTASITAVGNGWYRCSMVCSTATGNTVIKGSDVGTGVVIASAYTGDGVSGFFMYGAQLEAGAFATSYIPTTSAQVTRSADVALIQGSNFSGWYNQTEGSIFVNADAYAPSSTGYNRVYQIDDATNNNTIALLKNNGSASQFYGYVSVSGAAQATLYTTAVTANTPFKTALAYKANDFAFSFNGASPSTDTSGTVPTVTQMTIGSGSSTPINGHIRSLAYYPRRLSNQELQGITA